MDNSPYVGPIRRYTSPFYDEVMSIVVRHDPLGVIRLGLGPGEYAPPVGTIVRRAMSEFTPTLDIVYEELSRWTQAANGMYAQLLGPPEKYRQIADEIAALTTGRSHLHRVDWVEVHYDLRGDFDPVEIEAQIGIQADDRTHKGAPLSSRRSWPVAKESRVQYNSGLSHTTDAESQIGALLTRLRPAWPVLISLGQQFSANIDYVLMTEEPTGPGLVLTVDQMQAIIELNAYVAIDSYNFVPSI